MIPRRSLTAGLAAVVLGGLLSSVPHAEASAPPGPARRVIVELSGNAAVAAAPGGKLRAADAAEVGAARRAVASRQQEFLGKAESAGLRPESVRKLDLLVNAVAMTVPANELARLSALPGVAAVLPDTPVRAQTDVSVPLIGAPEVWKRKDPAGKAVRGAGVTVAVIDTGVDYTHPDLGGGFGPGHKVVAGYDFVNNDADPMDDNGHGTHVAGIIAGRAAEAGGITGVAPDATLVAYKVMDDQGSGYTSDIIAGIEAATDPANPHRADVINMSLGGLGDGTDPLGQAATAATRAGVVVVAAAGNSGPGANSVITPAAADGVIAVGASTSNLVLPTAYLAGPKPELLQTYRDPLSANPPAKPVTAPVVDIGTGTSADWSRAGDVRGKIVLARATIATDPTTVTTPALQLAREAEQRGAVALLSGPPAGGGGGPTFAATGDGIASVSAGSPGIQASGDSQRMDKIVLMGMDETQYAELSARLADSPVSVTIRGTDVTDQIASFSSRGPSQRFELKPDLVAPGVEIRSTVPKGLYAPGEYRMSGTSMAAPHVAGAAALLRQLHPGQSPGAVKSTLVGTAKPLSGTDPTAQGSGRLDVAAAASAVLTATPATLSFGLADLSRPTIGGTRTMTLSNTGTRRLNVTLKTSGAAQVTPRHVGIAAGGTATVAVRVETGRPAADTDVTGRVTVTPDRGPAITVPYLLVARPLIVQASPDPSDGHSTVFVSSPAALSGPPAVTVTPPHGKATTVTAVLDHGTWYRADVTGHHAGAYKVSVSGTASTGQRLIGSSGFEVTPANSRNSRWEPVGPNTEGGDLTIAPGTPQQAVLTQYGKTGPWLTTDSGATWSQLNRLPVSGGSGTVVIDAKQPDRWWYAVNGYAPPMTQGGILRTVDRGRTWQTLSVPDSHITALVTDEQTRTLIAVTTAGLYVSTDTGDTWTAYPTGVSGNVTRAAVSGDDLYLATVDGIWVRSGVLSGTLGPARQVYSPGSASIGALVADGSVVAAYVAGTGVVGSYDHGQTWSTLFTLPFGGTGLKISGGDVFLATTQEGWLGRNHGRTWSLIPAPLPRVIPLDYDRWANGSITMSADAAGLYRGTAAGTGYSRIGVQGGTVYDLAVTGNTLLAGTEYGVQRTELPVSTPEWGPSGNEGMTGEKVSLVAVSPKNPKVVWKVRVSGWVDSFFIYRSDDGGNTWEQKAVFSERPTTLTIDPADPNRVLVGFWSLAGAGLFATADNGTTWKTLHQGAQFDTVIGDPQDPLRLWLGNTQGLYRSDDGGATVTKVAEGPVSALELDGSRLLVGGDGVRVSTDGGRTFRTADTGGLPTRVSDLTRVGTALYAATTRYSANGLARGGRGVLRSTDNGLTWVNISTGLQNLDTTKLAASPDGRYLYAGTVNGGVHRLELRH
ncbi:S8 family serine peptidase [Actinacidiphila oryziradicis]|uniref:S8 family serine peptidase n=1 Tax=Actinacidiphila oryziradicis TaxID=2571141 RepID=UPI0023F026F1|nr:S8 family serine peptidase [Actinacidiphila oryziradicis]